ncbi:MAG TPA: TlpA disulfide reductase family protein [Rhodanobacteraceae bacterium]
MAGVALVLAMLGAEAMAAFLRHRGYADAGVGVWIAFLAALAGGRAVFVAHYWSIYRLRPWSMFDIRDLGFSWIGGVVALAVVVTLLAWRRRAWRLALPLSAAAGMAVWGLVGFTAFQLQAGSHPPLPHVTLHTTDGQDVALASLGGKPLVINLWATWCPPCRQELPMLVRAQRAQPDVRFVFADQGEGAAQVRRFLRSEGLAPRHVVLDGTGQLASYYRAPGFPTTVFVAADGRMREIHLGALSAATLQQHLRRLTATPLRRTGDAL